MRLVAVLALVAAAVAAAVLLRPAPAQDRPAADPPRAEATPAPARRARPLRRAHCPAALAGCREATGRVLYVEAVDADGDGDAHYVLAGGDITGPGLSVIDVGRHLRPRRLPRPGDLVSAAGPVFAGSFGQRQIEAVVVHQRRRRRRRRTGPARRRCA
jgi:hypothetical protein